MQGYLHSAPEEVFQSRRAFHQCRNEGLCVWACSVDLLQLEDGNLQRQEMVAYTIWHACVGYYIKFPRVPAVT